MTTKKLVIIRGKGTKNEQCIEALEQGLTLATPTMQSVFEMDVLNGE